MITTMSINDSIYIPFPNCTSFLLPEVQLSVISSYASSSFNIFHIMITTMSINDSIYIPFPNSTSFLLPEVQLSVTSSFNIFHIMITTTSINVSIYIPFPNCSLTFSLKSNFLLLPLIHLPPSTSSIL